MPTINQLTQTSDLSAGDLFPLYSQANGDARAAALSVILAYVEENFGVSFAEYVSQYSAPNASAFNVQVTDGKNNNTNVHLILTPTGGFAAGTVTMPAKASCVDKQELLVNCTQAVTALTVAGNGATVTGAPTTLAANAFFRLKYDAVTSTWYRVG